jgi:uncharacterized protein YlxP (DUF503 family)
MDPIHQDYEIKDRCLANGIQYQAYSTLGSQWVHHRGFVRNPVLNNPVLVRLAKKYNVSVAQIVLHWATRHEISVLPASTNIQRQRDNLQSGTLIYLTEQEILEIDALDGQVPKKQQHQRENNRGIKVHFENPRQDGGAIAAYWMNTSDQDFSDEEEEVPLGSIAAGQKITFTSYHGHKFIFRDPTNSHKIIGDFIVDVTKSEKSKYDTHEQHHVIPLEEL